MGTPWRLIFPLTLAAGWACGWAFWPGSGASGGPVGEGPGSQGTAEVVRVDFAKVPARRLSDADQSAGLTEAELASALADPQAAGARLKGSGRTDAIRGLCRHLALAPPPALTDFLTAVAETEALRNVLLGEATRWACSREPEAGIRLLASLAERSDIADLTKNALHFFPPKDLPVVKAWYEKMPTGSFKSALLKELMPVLQRADRREAIRLASAFPLEPQSGGPSRQSLLGEILSRAEIASLSPADQQALVQEFPEADRSFLQSQIVNQQFGNFANYDKNSALETLSILPEAERQDQAGDLFTRWAETDPLRASQGLSRLPEEAASPDLYRQFAAKWTEGNVGQASQWVSGLPDSPLKQAAITGLAGKLSQDYPGEAITWAGTLTDPAVKMKTLHAILSEANGPGRAAAAPDSLRKAVDALNLTAEERTGLPFNPATP